MNQVAGGAIQGPGPTSSQVTTLPIIKHNDFARHPEESVAPEILPMDPGLIAPRGAADTPITNSGTPQEASEADNVYSAPISRQMSAREVITQLVQHDILDMSDGLDHPTFGEHPDDTNGAFSDVYYGRLQEHGQEVAVKVLRVTVKNLSKNPKHLKNAARELHTWGKCKHDNVLPLLGLALFRGQIGMVSPWMNKGPLPDYLKEHQEDENPKANRIDICRRICEGLSYLHATGIIHGDLKGGNVLVSEDGTPVLADFGNSTLKDRSLKFTQPTDSNKLTARWSAPERLASALPLTKASDVYSLGMTIYEVITGQPPYHALNELNVLLMLAVPTSWVPPGRLESEPTEHGSKVILGNLLKACWSYPQEARPCAEDVANTMNTIPLGEVKFRFASL